MDQVLKMFKDSFVYSGKCNDYDENGNLVSNLFRDASHMAQVVEDENVVNLTQSQFLSLLKVKNIPNLNLKLQLNIDKQIAWIYDEIEDIHYFYYFKP